MDDTVSPSKRMKHEAIANQIFPNDILMIILKFLSFRESVELFSVACKDWRVAWKVFISNEHDYFKLLSNAKFSGEDLILMVRSPNRLPHIQALADFLFNNGLSTNA